MLANLFLQIPALAITLSAIGVLIFSAYLLYDVSAIVRGGETNYIMATIRLFAVPPCTCCTFGASSTSLKPPFSG